MNVISLKDYAKQHNISYEAVRKQVSRFKDDLSGHIIQDGRQQLLDEEAVAFLDARREKNPIAIIQQDKDDTISTLEAENKNLLQKVALLQDELLNEKNQRIELAGKIAKIELLEERAASAEQKVAAAEKQAIFARQREIEAETALEDMRREAKMRHDQAFEAEEQRAEAEQRAKAAEDIAELNGQEAAAYKKYAEDLEAYLNLPFFKRLTAKKPTFDCTK